MTPPTLLETARILVEHIKSGRHAESAPTPTFDGCWQLDHLVAAIAAEESKPKVERAQFWLCEHTPVVHVGLGGTDAMLTKTDYEWSFYAERPVPAPVSEPSIEERLETQGDVMGGTTRDLAYEAAAEIRRLRGKKE